MRRDKQSTREFIWLNFKSCFFALITLGFYIPFYANKKRHFLVSRSQFGTAKFNYNGDDTEYFWLVMKGILLSIITLGIYSSWMMISLLKFKLEATDLDGTVRFSSDLKGKDILIFSILAYLATILTVGLAIPWVINRAYALFINSVEAEGVLDFSRIQNIEAGGNALADVVAIEYDLDLGF